MRSWDLIPMLIIIGDTLPRVKIKKKVRVVFYQGGNLIVSVNDDRLKIRHRISQGV